MPDIVRHAAPADVPELVRLANRVFRGTRPGEMAGEFPLLLCEQNAGNLCVVVRDGRIMSLVGVQRFTMSVQGVDVPSASIGAVCTDADCRGQGLAGRALVLAVESARRHGDVLMPISGERSLYSRIDALPFGPSHQFVVDRDQLGRPDGRPYRDSDADAVIGLHESEPVRYRWEPEAFDRLLAAKLRFGGVSWVRQGPGGVDGWALLFCAGSLYGPRPGEAILVDSAGRPEIVASVCAAAMEAYHASRMRFRLPWHAEAMVQFFAPLTDRHIVAFARGATLKLLDLEGLTELFARRLAPLAPAVAGGTLRLTAGGREWSLDDPMSLHHVLFTQPDHWPAETRRLRDLAAHTEGILPIPLPDYGLCYV